MTPRLAGEAYIKIDRWEEAADAYELAKKLTPEEPAVAFIHQLAEEGLEKIGHHGPMGAMGVPRNQLPSTPGAESFIPAMSSIPVNGSLV